MSLSIDLKGMTLKDWIWIVGAGISVVGSWAVMGMDIKQLKETQIEQKARDLRQDDQMRDNRNEVIHSINRTSDEIKQEIRELRGEINKRK